MERRRGDFAEDGIDDSGASSTSTRRDWIFSCTFGGTSSSPTAARKNVFTVRQSDAPSPGNLSSRSAS